MSFYTSVHRMGGSILYRGYTNNGTRIHERVKFSPTFFLKAKEGAWTGKWTALDGTKVEPMEFESIGDAKDFMDTYKDVDNFKVFGNNNYVAQFINERFPGNIKADLKHIAIGNIDIEVKSDSGFPFPEQAAYPITSIAYRNSKSSIYHVWGLKHYDPSKCETIPEGCMVRYVKCNDEAELIMKFLAYWEEHYPDVITGWNIRLFDIPYIVNRIKRILGEELAKKLSPWNIVNYRQIGVKGKSLDTYEIYGVQQLDYMDLFQKFGYVYGPQESYSLNHICHVILGEKKLSYEEYGTLHGLYENNHQKFIDYNIRDVVLVDKLEEQTGLLALALIIAYKGGVNYPDTLGTTAIWDSIIYRYLSAKNIAIPPMVEKYRPEYPGGYVKDPHLGRHEWVVSFDLNSLYPMTIVQYNMSPETIVEGISYGMPADVDFYLNGIQLPQEIRDLNVAVAANGVMFRKDKQGFLPEIIESYYAERKATKKKMLGIKQKYEETHADDLKREMNQLDNTQQAIKILMNSLYGALGNKYFRYFDIRIAEGITLSGQLSIRWAEKYMNSAMNKIMNTTAVDYVIYMDTDSLYVSMSPLVKQVKPADPIAFLDKACDQKFEKVLEDAYNILFDQHNAFKNTMVMKREAIADAGIWTAKKRYILNVHNSEGVQYAEPKLKIMGIEAVKSSTPAIVRGKFKEAYKIMLSGTEKELQQFVGDFYEVFKNLAPEEVSFPRGISEIDKWRDGSTLFKKGVPIHVRGAIVYNHHVHALKLRDEEIKNGNKVKFCYLKMPNPLGTNVIAFPQFLPKELKAHEYIDYDMQFDKTFKDPLKLVSDAINWQLEHVNTLESFFG